MNDRSPFCQMHRVREKGREIELDGFATDRIRLRARANRKRSAQISQGGESRDPGGRHLAASASQDHRRVAASGRRSGQPRRRPRSCSPRARQGDRDPDRAPRPRAGRGPALGARPRRADARPSPRSQAQAAVPAGGSTRGRPAGAGRDQLAGVDARLIAGQVLGDEQAARGGLLQHVAAQGPQQAARARLAAQRAVEDRRLQRRQQQLALAVAFAPLAAQQLQPARALSPPRRSAGRRRRWAARRAAAATKRAAQSSLAGPGARSAPPRSGCRAGGPCAACCRGASPRHRERRRSSAASATGGDPRRHAQPLAGRRVPVLQPGVADVALRDAQRAARRSTASMRGQPALLHPEVVWRPLGREG